MLLILFSFSSWFMYNIKVCLYANLSFNSFLVLCCRLDDNCLAIDYAYSMTLYFLFVLSSCIIDEKKLPFKIHRVFMITYIVPQFVALASVMTLIFACKYLQSSIMDMYNTMVKIISIFSAIMASISLTFVFFIPQNLICIGYLVIISLTFAIGVACYNFKKDVWESKALQVFQPCHETNYSVITFTPFLMVLSLFIPLEFIWARLSIMLVLVGITFVYTYVKVMKEKHARNLEVDPLVQPMIQEDDRKIVS